MALSSYGCVLLDRGLYDELIPHPEEPYRLWCAVVRGLETSRLRRFRPALGCCARRKVKIRRHNVTFLLYNAQGGK
jgi:hypothetical protein